MTPSEASIEMTWIDAAQGATPIARCGVSGGKRGAFKSMILPTDIFFFCTCWTQPFSELRLDVFLLNCFVTSTVYHPVFKGLRRVATNTVYIHVNIPCGILSSFNMFNPTSGSSCTLTTRFFSYTVVCEHKPAGTRSCGYRKG